MLTPVDTNMVRVETPPAPEGPADIVVQTSGFSEAASLPGGFNYRDLPPQIVGLSPETGDENGGDLITLEISHFNGDFVNNPPNVFFGSLLASVIQADATTVWVYTPPCPPATVDVTVAGTISGDSAVLEDGFTFVAPPPKTPAQIVSVTPSIGEAGAQLTITTTGFDDNFTGYLPQVYFGTTRAASVVAIDSRTLRVYVPQLIRGKYDVTVESTGILEIAVLVDGFTYC